MPKVIVEIEWDAPEEKDWLCPDNVAIALHAYCENTKFSVEEVNTEENAALRTALKDGVEYFEADYLGEEAAKMVKGWEDLLEATT